MQAALHSRSDDIFRPEVQPVHVLDFDVSDVARVHAACIKSSWSVLSDSWVARHGIVVRMFGPGEDPCSQQVPPHLVPAVAQMLTARFASVNLKIDPGVYEPDPGSAVFVTRALACVAEQANPVIVDVGTGSGALAIAIAAARRDARVIATDVSPAAIECARSNAARNGVRNIAFACGSLLSPIDASLKHAVDVIVANLPWVSALEVAAFRTEETAWRGPLGTVCGTDADGLGLVRAVARDAVAWLKPGGSLILMAHAWALVKLAGEIGDTYACTYIEEEQLLLAEYRSVVP